jgi:hypothetical protein
MRQRVITPPRPAGAAVRAWRAVRWRVRDWHRTLCFASVTRRPRYWGIMAALSATGTALLSGSPLLGTGVAWAAAGALGASAVILLLIDALRGTGDSGSRGGTC